MSNQDVKGDSRLHLLFDLIFGNRWVRMDKTPRFYFNRDSFSTLHPKTVPIHTRSGLFHYSTPPNCPDSYSIGTVSLLYTLKLSRFFIDRDCFTTLHPQTVPIHTLLGQFIHSRTSSPEKVKHKNRPSAPTPYPNTTPPCSIHHFCLVA